MDEVPQAPENSALVRYGFATVFVVACLYDLAIGVRVAGVFILGQSIYQVVLGRVPLVGAWSWKTLGYLKGLPATVLTAGAIIVGMFFLFAPDVVLRLIASMSHR